MGSEDLNSGPYAVPPSPIRRVSFPICEGECHCAVCTGSVGCFGQYRHCSTSLIHSLSPPPSSSSPLPPSPPFSFETRSPYIVPSVLELCVDQADLKSTEIHLPLSPKCWDQRHEPPHSFCSPSVLWLRPTPCGQTLLKGTERAQGLL